MIKLLLFLATVFVSIPADADVLGSSPPCRYSATASVDGCSGSPAASPLTVQRQDFFSGYAQRSKQTWIASPHPPWNVAGVDYPVGIPPSAIVTPGTDAYERSTSGRGYGLKRPTNANFARDGIYGLKNGCSLGGGNRIGCAGTLSSITIDGYDFSDPINGGAYFYPGASLTSAPKLVIKNSYIAPGVNTGRLGYLIRYDANGPVTLQNNYMDGLGEQWEIWNNGVGGGVQEFVFVATPTLDATSADCGTEASICVQYNAFVNGPPRDVSYGTACTTICNSLVWRYNYIEGVSYPSSKFIGSIDNNGRRGPGHCLTVTSYVYGTVTIGSLVGGPGARQMKVTSTPCNGANSFTLTSSPMINQYAPLQTMYSTQGIHGDPQFVGVASNATKIPTTLGAFIHSYSTTLFPENAYGATGAVTWNTTIGPVVSSATIDNCTPSCGSGSAGNTLNVRTIRYIGLWPGRIAIGEAIGGNGSIIPGTFITGDGNGGAHCDNGSCTGTGGTGTYAVSGLPQSGNITSNWEFSGVNMTDLQIDHNVVVTNSTFLGKHSTYYAGSAGAVIGDNHAMTITNVDISNNFYDPTGAAFCVYPQYRNAPTGLPPTGNVNLLGNGSGRPDPKANTSLCYGRFRAGPYR